MAEDEHRGVDIEERERVFNGFIRGSVYVAIVTVLILIFLAIVGT
jgi:phosphotransferase system  glucose/maltose/N-acetylglucosamine-specific IIC component